MRQWVSSKAMKRPHNRMKTIIMAGGKETIISRVFPGVPKPLIPLTNTNEVEKANV